MTKEVKAVREDGFRSLDYTFIDRPASGLVPYLTGFLLTVSAGGPAVSVVFDLFERDDEAVGKSWRVRVRT